MMVIYSLRQQLSSGNCCQLNAALLLRKLYKLVLFLVLLSFLRGRTFHNSRLQEYSVETAIAIIADGSAILKIDTQHLRDLSFRVGSIYQFIGELHIQLDNEAILQARVGRNVDGLDLNLYHQSLQLLRQFQAERYNNLMQL
ncbi:CST complex subunit TEN1-like isoform X1 [Pistacia vera]|uniref:CST complex subunit TEN1-like isoform X1 n=1 Tax=Pistacia vera TaxID=55513 RepID=UPI0012630BD3|nr:CST complex subunit TEN1-like isoform X1 [Pistacia vera]XP_031276007.1 CST complex subunit TEN1-like isoform X1 [Pistacia vera]XP_031276008.1 CST complex subunit TEN1-like isoform X1 [Pistacia vera]